MTNPTDKKCMCGEPWTKGVNHQTDKPCYLQPRNSLHLPTQCKQKDDLVDIQDEIQEDTTSMEEKMEALSPSPNSASGWEDLFNKKFVEPEETNLRAMTLNNEPLLLHLGAKAEEVKSFIREVEQAARAEALTAYQTAIEKEQNPYSDEILEANDVFRTARYLFTSPRFIDSVSLLISNDK